MQRQFGRIATYTTAAQWVTGDRRRSPAEQDSLAREVKALYTADYIRQWQDYLSSATIHVGGTLGEAGRRIGELGGPTSPVLRLLSVAAQNTNVDSTSIAKLFRPVHAVVPPNAGNALAQPTNQGYVNALLTLGSVLEGSADAKSAGDAARQLRFAAGQVALNFTGESDPAVTRSVTAILEAPASSVSALVETTGRVVDRASDFCESYRSIANRFPIGADTPEVSIREFTDMFGPGGTVAKLQNQLSGSVSRHGRIYARRADAEIPVSERFLRFLGGLTRVRESLYGNGRSDPAVSITVRGKPNRDVPTLTLRMDDQNLQWSVSNTDARTFVWRGESAKQAQIGAESDSGRRFDSAWPTNLLQLRGSPWSLLRVFEKPDHRERGATADTYKFALHSSAAVFQVESGRDFISREVFAGLQQCPPITDK
jgi:type VI secretion system protein ImpL